MATANLTIEESGGAAIYDKLSFINHSCSPNARMVENVENVENKELWATRYIQAGEEVTMSYVKLPLLSLPGIHRRHILKLVYGFDCKCTLCAQECADDQ